MLEHLRRSGTLALVDQLYDEDAAGIEREYVTVEEFIAMLEERDRP
jgi:hypothetical protein